MSEFDKEAEREKLRKQFAEDEKDREETERMSELLLQGATMTNKHCEQCGNPLFRQNGNTFCPTCGGTGRAAPAEEAETHPTEGAETRPADAGTNPAQARAEPASTPTSTPASTEEVASNPSVSTPTPGDDDLGEARAGLVRTLTTFVQRAEGAENPGHARELLSTAREAAETLAVVDDVRQNR